MVGNVASQQVDNGFISQWSEGGVGWSMFSLSVRVSVKTCSLLERKGELVALI